MAIAPYIFMTINITVAILTSLQYTYPEVAQVCYTTNAYNPTYVAYAAWMALVYDTLGIVIYVFVIFEYRQRFSKVNIAKNTTIKKLDAQAQRAIDAQRKVRRSANKFYSKMWNVHKVSFLLMILYSIVLNKFCGELCFKKCLQFR